MRKIIYEYDYKNRIIYILNGKKKEAFYMTNRLFKLFGLNLKKGVLIDFMIGAQKRIINRVPVQQINYFNQIVSLKPYRILYDFESLRADMHDVLMKHDYYLFVDFEMSMPGYEQPQKPFIPEIIQAGYVLSKKFEAPLIMDGYYVQNRNLEPLSKRTLKFLNIEQETYDQNAKSFKYFHNQLKSIMTKYHPKIVIWGKNDQTVLLDTYKRTPYQTLFSPFDFIDLLKLHRDYYNLDNDLGLFKAFKMYFDLEIDQSHDAYADALITKHVFDAFLSQMTDYDEEESDELS